VSGGLQRTGGDPMKKLMIGAVGALAIGVSTLLGAGAASATTNDGAFLQILAERGIYAIGAADYQLIQTGHGVCVDMMNGYSFHGEVWALQRNAQLAGGMLTSSDAAYFIGASQAAYCPWTYTPVPQPQLNRAI